MKKFFIADTHFNHENIISYCDRPFANAEEMNETLIRNWNSVVSRQDMVYFLGDFACHSKKESIIEVVAKLKGRKLLIMGNHDRRYKASWWLKKSGFEEVSRFPILVEETLILSHEPIFMSESMPYVNVFGHVHNNDLYKDISRHGFCVSVERINYTPIELSEIKNRLANFRGNPDADGADIPERE
ncbi:MAG: metallophosphoesterase [Planctomycetia bacterium]|nr:metallophosphoesterase [Planctomycetia bacterium]